MKFADMNIRCTEAFLSSILICGGLMLGAMPAAAAGKAEEKVSIPATSDAIWQAIDKEAEQLATLIQSGKLEDVHHRAFAIRDLVAALPAKSASLAPDKVAQVKANAKFVDTLAERLDAAGDAKDKAATESNFQKLKAVLKTMRGSYPGIGQK
jgi:hypothetical protein